MTDAQFLIPPPLPPSTVFLLSWLMRPLSTHRLSLMDSGVQCVSIGTWFVVCTFDPKVTLGLLGLHPPHSEGSV